MNGFNNNPTTTHYLSAYRKIVSNNSRIAISTNAYCSPLDETLIISDAEKIGSTTQDLQENLQLSSKENKEMRRKETI